MDRRGRRHRLTRSGDFGLTPSGSHGTRHRAILIRLPDGLGKDSNKDVDVKCTGFGGRLAFGRKLGHPRKSRAELLHPSAPESPNTCTARARASG